MLSDLWDSCHLSPSIADTAFDEMVKISYDTGFLDAFINSFFIMLTIPESTKDSFVSPLTTLIGCDYQKKLELLYSYYK
jgi:hypothetical protein